MDQAYINDLLSEESYKDLFDHANDLIQMVDLEGRVLYVNHSWTRILEYSLEEIQGKPIYIFIDKEDQFRYLEYRNEIIHGEVEGKEIAIKFISKSGQTVHIEGSASLRKKNGQPFYTRGIFRDITTRIENESRLRERESNLLQLLLNAPDAIIVIDTESIITFWNPAAEEMFGWTTDEVINQPLRDFIIPVQHREAHYHGMKRYIATGEKHVINNSVEITALNKRGEEFYISLTISPTNFNGDVAFISFIRDIRKQKKNEAELEKKRQQLEESNHQLEQYAHVASHDMKEPIRKINVFRERLERELGNNITEAGKSYLSKINSSTERLKKMVEGVFEYATAGSTEIVLKENDLNAIIQNIQNDLEVMIEQKNMVFKYSNLPEIMGVEFLLYQLFYNLVNNSLKFSKAGIQPWIEITAKDISPGDMQELPLDGNTAYTQVKVNDNGIGFNQEYASAIFKTFTRLNTRTEYEGTGLGLSLCKSIMEKHNGLITAEGKEGVGATFTMFFPKTKVS